MRARKSGSSSSPRQIGHGSASSSEHPSLSRSIIEPSSMTKTAHTTERPPSLDADEDRSGSGVLLGLEPPSPPDIEKAGQNLTRPADLDHLPRHTPLLGTICSQSIDNAGGSSKRRSPESVCYTALLHSSGHQSSPNPRKTAANGREGCYLAFHARWEISTSRKVSWLTASASTATRCPLP